MTLNKILEEIDADEARKIVINREKERVKRAIELNSNLYKKTLEEIYKTIKEEAQRGGTNTSYAIHWDEFKFPPEDREGEDREGSSAFDERLSPAQESIITNFARGVKEHLKSKGYKVLYYMDDDFVGYTNWQLVFEINWG